MSFERLCDEDICALADLIAVRLQNHHKSKSEICKMKHISPSTLNAWIADGLPVVKFGAKQVRIDVRDVDKYLESKKQ